MPEKTVLICDNPKHPDRVGEKQTITSTRGGSREVIICNTCRAEATWAEIMTWSRPAGTRKRPGVRTTGTDLDRLLAIKADD